MDLDRLLHVNAWVVFGLMGQLMFSLRFLVQWLVSERRGQSTIPVAFWYLSILGGGSLFVYALWYCQDPVFTLGQSAGLLVYTRNLILIRRKRDRSVPVGAHGAVGPGA